MSKYKNLPDIFDGKVIPRNFGHIQHLAGSKMIDDEDKLLSAEQQVIFTVCKRHPLDNVIITEKIDGMNAGVVKKNGLLYPINRKGYDVRKMGIVHSGLELLGESWASWVDDHYALYDSILDEGERLVFENAIVQHTLRYEFKGDPVFLLAKVTADNKKVCYSDLCGLAEKYGLRQPPLLSMGIAVPPEIVIKQYPKGLVGVQGQIEGIVYNYEHDGKHEACAKYVSNPIMGTIHPEPKYYNKIK